MTRKAEVLAELERTPPKTTPAISPALRVHVPVEVTWCGELAPLKAILFDNATDFRGRWFLARLSSGLRVGVQRTADGPYIVRLTVNGVATPQEQAEGQQLIRLWGLKGWAKTTEKAAVEHRITLIENEVA